MEGLNQNLAIVVGADDRQSPGMNADATGALQRELSKWRERVPRLVAALRERTDEVAGLRRELQALLSQQAQQGSQGEQDARPAGHAGARAREELIIELEHELAALREAHEQLQGELHARYVSIATLKRDLSGWKDKWQSLATAFDEMAPPATAGEVAALEQALAGAAAERDDLRARNADLFETTTRANRQMETLADDLAELRQQLKDARAGQAQAVDACDQATAALDAARAELQTALTERDGVQAAFDAARTECDALLAGRDALLAGRDAAIAASLEAETRVEMQQQQLQVMLAPALAAAQNAAQQAAELRCLTDDLTALRIERDALVAARVEQQSRIEQLESADADREHAEGAAQAESQRLQSLLRQYQARQAQLEQQLSERSALVVSLEQDKNALDLERRAFEVRRVELEESLARTKRHAEEHAEHILQLDDRGERQKALLLELEQELAGSQAAVVERRRGTELAGKEAAIRALELQVAALQGMLAEQAGAPDAGAESAASIADRRQPGGHDRDGQTLLVLSQQLRDARARNQALLERLRELETRTPIVVPHQPMDDLTQIRGVGPRLAEHLGKLGLSSFRQIAELDPQTLDDPGHVLAGLKSRIVRDGWIEQAVSLGGH